MNLPRVGIVGLRYVGWALILIGLGFALLWFLSDQFELRLLPVDSEDKPFAFEPLLVVFGSVLDIVSRLLEHRQNTSAPPHQTVSGDHSAGIGGDAHAPVTTGSQNRFAGRDYHEHHHHPAYQRSPRHQLRAPLRDFVGRVDEITALHRALTGGGAAAICGLRGMGGIGKTELAMVVANQLAERFPDAQLVLDLFGATNPITPEAALQSAIRAFEQQPNQPQAKLPDDLASLKQRYTSHLYGKHVLILADDARDQAQVRPLLPPAGCALLITTRQTFTLPGMRRFDLGTLPPDEAAALLLAIEKRIAEHAPRLAELCGYLPLALRVSAELLANDDTRPVPRYLAQLEAERLRHLRDPDNPDDPAASVEASLNLSYTALPVEAQRVFAQLGVFVGDFSLEAAEAVLTIPDTPSPLPDTPSPLPDTPSPLPDTLALLRRRSLLDYDPPTARFDLHDLARAFALARLQQQDDERPTRLRHARYYEELISYAQDELYLKGQVLEGLALFDKEHRQFDMAWQWIEQQPPADDTDQLLIQFEGAVYDFADMRYDLQKERIPHLQALLSASQRLSNKYAEGAALGSLGIAYKNLGDEHRAIEFHEQRLAIARDLGDRRGEGNALGNLGNAYSSLGDYARAIDYYEQVLALMREIGDRRGEGSALGNLGNAYSSLGDYARAIDYYEQVLALMREIGDRHGEGNALGSLGIAYDNLGDYPRAIDYHEQALVISRDIGDRRSEGQDLGNLGNAYHSLGDYPRAIDYHEQALAIARDIGDRRSEGQDLGNLGNAYHSLGDYPRAIASHEQALVISRDLGDRRGEGTALGNLGLAYDSLGDYPQAITSYEQAKAIDQEIGNQEGVARHSWNLGLLYEAQGDLARAVPLMQVWVDFLQQIGHPKYEERAPRLEAVKRKLAGAGGTAKRPWWQFWQR